MLHRPLILPLAGVVAFLATRRPFHEGDAALTADSTLTTADDSFFTSDQSEESL